MNGSENSNPDHRPYAPTANVIAMLNRFRTRNLPEKIDSEYLRDAGITDSLNPRVLFALRFLGFIDDDAPTSILRSIARSTDEEYQTILAGVLRDTYRDVFEVLDPTQDQQSRFINFFRRYSPASQRDRMVTFFLGMCREAGIPTIDAPRNRVSGATAKARTSRSTSGPKAAPRSTGQSKVADNSSVRDKVAPSPPSAVGMPPALELLVRSLPPAGTAMSIGKRSQWMALAKATLDYIYPLEDDNYQDDEDEDEAED